MNRPILILDGGLGTSLEQNYHCTFSPRTPLWSADLLVSDPARLRACQSDFGRVPVDVLLTATYQVSVHGFAGTHDPDTTTTGIPRGRIPRYIDDAVRIAAEATGHAAEARVALSIGPYGACMVPSQEYSGAYDAELCSEEALFAWHRDRMQLFAAAVEGMRTRIGFVALETVPRIDEIRAMRRALASTPALADTPCWLSCLYPGEEGRLPDGASVEAAVRAMLDPAVAAAAPLPPCWGIGINCTKVYKLNGLLRQYEDAVDKMLREGVLDEWPALVLYPDGTNGEVYNTTTQTWEMPDGEKGKERDSWAKQLADIVRDTQRRGDWKQIVVGGCCMAGAEDIAALRAELL